MSDVHTVIYPESIMQRLWSDAQKAESPLLDFDFRFSDGTLLKAHRNVLAASSPFFETKFSIGMSDSTSHESFIESFAPDSFRSFLEFLYLGKSSLFQPSFFAQLFEMSEFFDVPLLGKWLIDEHITDQTFLTAMSLAVQFSHSELLKKCNSVAVQSITRIGKEDLVGISEEVVGTILLAAKEHYMIPRECFKFFSKWCAACDFKSSPLLFSIDLQRMSKCDIDSLVIPSGLVPDYLAKSLKMSNTTQDFSQLPSKPKFTFGASTDSCRLDFSPLTETLVAVCDGVCKTYGRHGNLISSFDADDFPCAITVSSQGFVHLLSIEVHVFNLTGKLLFSYEREELLDDAYSLSVDHVKQQVHVSNGDKNCVFVYSEEGKYLSSYGSGDDGPGKLDNPHGIAVNGELGLVYVSDHTSQIKVFTTDGEFVKTFGHSGGDIKGKLGQLSQHLAVHEQTGHVFVVDLSEHTLQIFTKDGDWVNGLGGAFGGPSFFGFSGIAVGYDGTIFVGVQTGLNAFEIQAF